MARKVVVALCLIAMQSPWSRPVHGAVPKSFTYQGNLFEGGLPVNATKSMTFRITDSSGGQSYWTSGPISVPVVKGHFKAELSAGGVSWEGVAPYLEVSVEGTVISPREPLNAVPYALVAEKVSGAALLASTQAFSGQNVFLNRVGVAGELTAAGGIRFPDGTVQTTAAAGRAVAGSFVAANPSLTVVTNCAPAYVRINRGPSPAGFPGWERWDWAGDGSIRVGSGILDSKNIAAFAPNGFVVATGNHVTAGETWWYYAICK